MKTLYRRYELLLPRRFQDKSPVPDELIGQTVRELREQAVSSGAQTFLDGWSQGGKPFSDAWVHLFVDLPDRPQHRAFFKDFKEQLKGRFQQIDIWLTTYLIEVL